MNQSNLEEFAGLMASLDAAYNQDSSNVRADIYWEALKDCEMQDVKAAFVRAIQTLPFYPKVSELRAMILGQPQDQAALAWRKVEQAIRHPGTYENVTFDDPVIHFVIEAMGGWPAMGLIDAETDAFRSQDFRRLYGVGLRRNIKWPDVPAVLKGRFALEDAANMLVDTHRPKMIECDYLTPQRRTELGPPPKPVTELESGAGE